MAVKDWLPAAARASAIERRLEAGETLFRLGDKAASLCEVIAGRVRLVRIDRAGHEIILYVAGPGDTLAEASLYSPAYQCDAIASTDAVVRLYPKSAMLTGFEKEPGTAQAFSAMLARQLVNLRTRLEQRNIRSARERLHHFLALNVGADGRTVELAGTLKDLAAELGLTHEALYRTLAELERAGEIRRSRGKIILRRRRGI